MSFEVGGSVPPESHFRSPAAGVIRNGNWDLDILVADICPNFSTHDVQKIKAILDKIQHAQPVDSFKLLLVAAIAAHPCVNNNLASAPAIANAPIGIRWHLEMHQAIAEFCNVIEFPSAPETNKYGDLICLSLAPWLVDIPPTPTPPPSEELVDHPMGDEGPETPRPAECKLSPVPMPTPTPPPAALARAAPPPLAPKPPAPSTGNPLGSTALPSGATGKGKDKAKVKGKGKAPAHPPPAQKVLYATVTAAPAAPSQPVPPPRASLVISMPDASTT